MSTMHDKLHTKVCHLYYREHLTQADIGARLGVSRHKVGRLLREALERDVVRIEIRSPHSQSVELERRLETALGLKGAVIVEAEPGADEAVVKRQVCEAGSAFLSQLMPRRVTVGIGWGSTTSELVKRLPPQACKGGRVVQITGGNKALPNQFDCHEVSRRLAEKLGVQPVLLHAPGIVDRKATRDVLVAETSIAETFRLFDQLDVAVVGVGSFVPVRSSTLLASGYVAPSDLAELIGLGAVGDVFSYFIDDQGGLVPTPLHGRMITIGVEQIRKIPWSIAVATGATKARAMRAAVLGRFVNALVIDSDLAEALLDLTVSGRTIEGSRGKRTAAQRGPGDVPT